MKLPDLQFGSFKNELTEVQKIKKVMDIYDKFTFHLLKFYLRPTRVWDDAYKFYDFDVIDALNEDYEDDLKKLLSSHTEIIDEYTIIKFKDKFIDIEYDNQVVNVKQPSDGYCVLVSESYRESSDDEDSLKNVNVLLHFVFNDESKVTRLSIINDLFYSCGDFDVIEYQRLTV